MRECHDEIKFYKDYYFYCVYNYGQGDWLGGYSSGPAALREGNGDSDK